MFRAVVNTKKSDESHLKQLVKEKIILISKTFFTNFNLKECKTQLYKQEIKLKQNKLWLFESNFEPKTQLMKSITV